MSDAKPILIAGPTASGKSALALALAERLGGVIINADSMQVYSDLRILSARPSLEDEARVPHRLYGHVPGREAYSAGRFVKEAAEAIAAAQAAGQRAIVVGGTGLYFKALLEGLSPIPPVDDGIRNHWRRLADERGTYALWTALMQDDPVMALRLDPSDTQRIVRALEVFHSTGKSLSYWQEMPGTAVVAADQTIKIRISLPREELRARADARFDQMMDAGALREIEKLSALDLDPDLPVMRALGVRPLLEFVRGTLGKDEAAMQAKAETRQFIKRQETWARQYMIAWETIETTHSESLETKVIPFIHS